MSALSKKHVESLLASYDNDPQEALLACLRIVLSDVSLTWQQAIQHLPESWNKTALLSLDVHACDELARHLVETRSLEKF